MPPTIVTATALLFSMDRQPIIAVQFDISPQWHIYWQNPGDSGLPTTLSTTNGPLETHYPVPSVFTAPGDITTYGYANTATLFSPEAHRDVQEQSIQVSWLACKKTHCIPGEAEVFVQKPSRSQKKELQHLFEDLPQRWPASVEVQRTDSKVSLHWPTTWNVSAVEVFPDSAVGLVLTSTETTQHSQSTTTSLRFSAVPASGTAIVNVITETDTKAYRLSL